MGFCRLAGCAELSLPLYELSLVFGAHGFVAVYLGEAEVGEEAGFGQRLVFRWSVFAQTGLRFLRCKLVLAQLLQSDVEL